MLRTHVHLKEKIHIFRFYIQHLFSLSTLLILAAAGAILILNSFETLYHYTLHN